MLKIKSLFAVFIAFVFFFLVGCTGDPAEEVNQKIYNTTFSSNQSTISSTTIVTTIAETQSQTQTVVETLEVNATNSITVASSVAKTTKKIKPVVVVGNNKTSKTAKSTKMPAEIITQTSASTTQSISITTTQSTTIATTPTTTLAPLSDDDICFVTASGEKYHREGCRYLSKSCIEMIVKDAKEKAYTPCKVCKP